MASPLQPLIDRLPKPMRNRYFLVLVLFFAWMIFFDHHDFFSQMKLQRDVNKLEKEYEQNKELVKTAEQERMDLEYSSEKIAREEYYMNKSGEDIFVIVPEEKDKK